MFEVSESSPFILMNGSRLKIPTGIQADDKDPDKMEIPLMLVEKSNDVYHFIATDETAETAVMLTVPVDTVLGESNVKVTSFDLEIGIAEAVFDE